MKKYLSMLCLIMAIICCGTTHANWFQDIINAINAQGGITNGWLSSINSRQGEMLDNQKDIDRLMKEVNGYLSGHSGWGSYQFHDYQSYGDGANDWSSVMQMAESGHGNGALGQTINGISDQFPIDKNNFNKGVSEEKAQKYYAMKSETLLATRAASQLDYDKIQDQIAYQQMLQKKIEETKDLKAAVDLSSRIQVEGNLINLEVLRQSALSNQQQAMTEQANVNGALSNAKFLTK